MKRSTLIEKARRALGPTAFVFHVHKDMSPYLLGEPDDIWVGVVEYGRLKVMVKARTYRQAFDQLKEPMKCRSMMKPKPRKRL